MNLLKLAKPSPVAANLRQFYNSFMADIRSLEALSIDVSACAPFIVPILEEKLPGKIRSSIGDCGVESNFDLKRFINGFKEYVTRQEQSQALHVPQASTQQPSPYYESYEPPSTLSTMTATVNPQCLLCKGTHTAIRCPLPASEKSATVIRNKLCLNCLVSGHRSAQCNVRGRCAKCKGKHHTSIHGIQIYPTRRNDLTN